MEEFSKFNLETPPFFIKYSCNVTFLGYKIPYG